MVTMNNRDPRPIYEQVKDNYRKLIVSGVLSPDEKLPSVRELASELAINPNTIQRAYRELENEGYVYSVPGKGSFVGARDDVNRARREELMAALREQVRELRYLGVSAEEIRGLLEESEENT